MPALDLMDAGREARPRLASVLAKATWNQHYVQIPTFDRLSLKDISSSVNNQAILLKPPEFNPPLVGRIFSAMAGAAV